MKVSSPNLLACLKNLGVSFKRNFKDDIVDKDNHES